MKNIFYILLLLPTIIFAQYPSNSGQKITLGEQTTADGLVFRGVASIDTVSATSKITRANKKDTSAFLLLDTVTNLLWHYKTASNGWIQAGGGVSVSSFSAGTTGLTPSTATTGAVTLGGTLAVANGGTGQSTLAAAEINTGTGTINFLPKYTATGTTFGNSNASDDGTTFNVNLQGKFTGLSGSRILTLNAPTNGGSLTFEASGTAFADMGSYPSIIGGGSATDFVFNTRGYSSLTLSTAFEPRITILSGGNVGIGTASPTEKLHVNGNGLFTGNVIIKGASENLIIIDGTTYSGFRLQRNGTPKFAFFNNNAGTDFFDIYNYTTSSSAFKINPTTNETTLAGSLSLGTPLAVANGGTGSATQNFVDLTTTQSSIGGAKTFTSAVTATQFNSLNSNASTPSFIVSSGNGMYNAGTNIVGFSTAATERMRITSDGNVGIGTASPNKQSFTKALTVNAVSSNVGFELSLGDVAGFDIFYNNLLDVYLTNRTNGSMIFRTNSTERMRITSTGNVGIGTTSPAARLVVSNGGANGLEIDPLSSSGTETSIFSYNRSGTVWTPYRFSGMSYKFQVNGTTDAVSILSNGNVGIGTASPTQKLHVVGNGLFTGNGSFGSYLGLNNRTTPIYSEQLTVGSFSVPKITLAQSGGYRWSTYIDATDAKYRIRYEDGSIDPLVIDRLGAITTSSSLNVIGTVRINSASAPDANYYLQLENSASQKAKANAWDTYSDKRIKTDIQPIYNAIDKVNLLNPVYYQKHDSYVENDFLNIDYDSSVKSLGFIAQEVYNIIPEAVNTGTTNELWAMDYTKIIPILTKAIQEQNVLIKALEQRILILENK